MKKLAIRIAFICLVLFVSVPIFKTQIEIYNMSVKTEQLEQEIHYMTDKVEFAKEKLDRIKSGDEAILSEYIRDNLDCYDPEELIIYNDITD